MVGVFWQNNLYYLIISVVGAILFSAYLLYDIQARPTLSEPLMVGYNTGRVPYTSRYHDRRQSSVLKAEPRRQGVFVRVLDSMCLLTFCIANLLRPACVFVVFLSLPSVTVYV